MFSIAAINDTDSKGQWEPLAPSKEAQEFHLSQTYHEGLLKLHAKEYEKACELLETVLKDPLISSAQVNAGASDGHLLQLRFLALKNLATVFLQQGSAYYERALQCYIQAVEIDAKDSVVWNQLGTLSCSMGLLSISRWAFEQGLLCSPNNWNCMEKLLEVLIAIGDEAACVSVGDMILRHWPSHSRALHVKSATEETETVPFAPRGIDKLEPKHVRLKFPDKRKAANDNPDMCAPVKRLNQKVELLLAEASWSSVVSGLLDILLPLSGCDSERDDKEHRSGDVCLDIKLPSVLENVVLPLHNELLNANSVAEGMSQGDSDVERAITFKEKAVSNFEEQPQERRSTRLVTLRSRKPGKEGSEFATSKNLAEVIKFLEPFIVGSNDKGSNGCDSCSTASHESATTVESEFYDVTRFVKETSKNYGAYHVSHLLLEAAATRRLTYLDPCIKFLEMEKLTRHWGQDRTLECNVFLAELYYDIGLTSSGESGLSDFVSDASYQLCKIIEQVALEYPSNSCSELRDKSSSLAESFQGSDLSSSDASPYQDTVQFSPPIENNSPFWIRFFWLSGRVSLLEGNKAKALEQFSMSLSLLLRKDSNSGQSSVRLPHCKTIKELTVDRLVYEINMLKVDLLLEKVMEDMTEKELYLDCINLLAPLVFCTVDVHIDLGPLSVTTGENGQGMTYIELRALDTLIKAGESTKPMDIEVILKSRQRKLQILVVAAGVDDLHLSSKLFQRKSGSLQISSSETESKESFTKRWNCLVVEEIKAISQCVSKAKEFIDQDGDRNGVAILKSSIRDIQYLLLAAMCNVARTLSSRTFSGSVTVDQTEQKQRGAFLDAAITFCKLQHLDGSADVKTQVELIVAIHDLLAEYGICCAGEGGAGEEGTFLKFAIKHLLALDMKLKSCFQNGEDTQQNMQLSEDSCRRTDGIDMEIACDEVSETSFLEKDLSRGIYSDSISSVDDKIQEVEHQKVCGNEYNQNTEGGEHQSRECQDELSEEEREELELKIDQALDQCFFCLYGLNLRSDSSYEDELATHKNTSRGEYQTKEQCADVFQYILPSARVSSKTGLVKLRRVLRAIRKHFPQPPGNVLDGNPIDRFLDDPDLCEDKLSEEAGSDGFLQTMTKMIFSTTGGVKQYKKSVVGSSEPYLDVYRNLYFFLAQSEEMSASDKWPGFVLTKEGEEFVQQNANLFKFDLLYNPLRFESWQRLANIYDEEVDLLLNDGSKHINVLGWRKNAALPQRVETSRRRSRRCLLMSLALAKTPDQQCEIHELLALVYYDSLQNVVPLFDQRSVLPTKDAAWTKFCENSMEHFRKAFANKQDWSHAFYMGKLCEKLGYAPERSLSYYDKAIALNTSAVDPVYRMHASRLKLLCKHGHQNLEYLKVISSYSFNQSTRNEVIDILGKVGPEVYNPLVNIIGISCQMNPERKPEELRQMEDAWNMLYNDCLSALETCIEGDLKHFHKARYMLAQGLHRRGKRGDLERAKDELSFCFKSSRSAFTFNMWEIDGMVKKGRRRTPGIAANKKSLEVNLPESSRKFITCIRKYLLFYLKLLEEAKDICTLDKAFISIRADKRFCLCIEDLVPVALGRYIKAIIASRLQADILNSGTNTSEHLLEKLFGLFMEQGNLWPDVCSLPELKGSEVSEGSLYGYLHQYINSLERNGKLETIEAINEKVRKRFKNPKLSNSNCAKVCRHASIAWCRSLIIGLALITPLEPGISSDIQDLHQTDNGLESSQFLCVDLQTSELWNPSFEDASQLKHLEIRWGPVLSKVKNTIVKKASDENLDTVRDLLRCLYNFYRESSSITLPSVVNLYLVPYQLIRGIQSQTATEGVEILDVSIPRKLLLWAYTLLQGRYASVSAVVKYCEENVKPKMKKTVGPSSTASTATVPNTSTACPGGAKDGVTSNPCPAGGEVGAPASASASTAAEDRSAVLSHEEDRDRNSVNLQVCPNGSKKSLFVAPQLQQCRNSSVTDKGTSKAHEGEGPNDG
ncbi:calcineurin-binding protein 1 isoform X2 [Rhodamnia argentea]|uniref:Calcineurin-binding protein 1 isoform X2 n=1 Tax=Rhodamnia argentea TaxID=178133 RepID=A0A8B8P6R6_9MYRT|nr:calcineurin-binding protein 1 isoform X2 [Rhodamnia argentea]